MYLVPFWRAPSLPWRRFLLCHEDTSARFCWSTSTCLTAVVGELESITRSFPLSAWDPPSLPSTQAPHNSQLASPTTGRCYQPHEEWASWDMGLIPLIRGGRSILTLISLLKPPPSLTVISRPVLYTHHQHQEWTFPQIDKWHQIKEH